MKKFFIPLVVAAVTLCLNGCLGVTQPVTLPVTLAPTALPTATRGFAIEALPTEELTETFTPTALPSPQATPLPLGTESNMEHLLQAARADLSARANVPDSAIVVSSLKAVEWPDASLGCPRRGVMYIQVLTPGYLIVLEANGQTYAYHTNRTDVMYCEK